MEYSDVRYRKGHKMKGRYKGKEEEGGTPAVVRTKD
jgi:hypothetical protein